MPGYSWIMCSSGEIPANAVKGGLDGDTTLYVGRTAMFGDLLPGKVITEFGGLFVSWGGEEHQGSEYEVLVKDEGTVFEWVLASGGSVPEGAVEGGQTQDGDKLYIGRAPHENTLTCGKVHPGHGCLYIPYGGQEHSYDSYEVLVCRS